MKSRLIFFLTIVLIVILCMENGESFTNKNEKATSIREWFNNTITPTYIGYRNSIGSNIVEYEDMTKLFKVGDFTVNNIVKAL